jgi:hypothetical protein
MGVRTFLTELPPEIIPDDSFEEGGIWLTQYHIDRKQIWPNTQAIQLAIDFLRKDGEYWVKLDQNPPLHCGLPPGVTRKQWYDETIVGGFEKALKWLEESSYHMVLLRTRYYSIPSTPNTNL